MARNKYMCILLLIPHNNNLLDQHWYKNKYYINELILKNGSWIKKQLIWRDQEYLWRWKNDSSLAFQQIGCEQLSLLRSKRNYGANQRARLISIKQIHLYAMAYEWWQGYLTTKKDSESHLAAESTHHSSLQRLSRRLPWRHEAGALGAAGMELTSTCSEACSPLRDQSGQGVAWTSEEDPIVGRASGSFSTSGSNGAAAIMIGPHRPPPLHPTFWVGRDRGTMVAEAERREAYLPTTMWSRPPAAAHWSAVNNCLPHVQASSSQPVAVETAAHHAWLEYERKRPGSGLKEKENYIGAKR